MEATEAAEAPEASRSHRSHQEPPGATRSQDRRSHRSHEATRSQDKKNAKKIPLQYTIYYNSIIHFSRFQTAAGSPQACASNMVFVQVVVSLALPALYTGTAHNFTHYLASLKHNKLTNAASEWFKHVHTNIRQCPRAPTVNLSQTQRVCARTDRE